MRSDVPKGDTIFSGGKAVRKGPPSETEAGTEASPESFGLELLHG